MQKKKSARYWIGRIHLVLGLTSGTIIVFLGITGCLLAFQREIENATQTYRYVKAEEKSFLPPSQLKAIAEKQVPQKHIHAVLYQGKENATQVIFYQFEPVEYYHVVYLNPYDGSVLKVKNMDEDFFRIVLMGHFYLWLPPEIGQPIVASATLIFVIMMISGLILWWPRNKAAKKQRFSIKWNASFKRKNYDLHNVLGFYVTWIAIILATTGLVWGFQWFANSLYATAGGDKSLVYAEPLSDTTQTSASTASMPAIDVVWNKMKKEYPAAEVLEVHIPEAPASPIAANANSDSDTYWKIDYRYFDQYTFNELPVDHIFGRYQDADVADKMIRMNYDVHTGGILGLPGKILMFCASLIAASLPVTGFLLWRGRRRARKAAAAVSRTAEPLPRENEVAVQY